MAIAENLEAKIEALMTRLDALERENKILREENAALRKHRFGRSTERLEPGQLGFFEEQLTVAEGLTPTPPKDKSKKKSGHGRAHFPPNLPREVIVLDVPETERLCSCCNKPMKRIGEEITERGHCIPAKLLVKQYVRPKYACPDGHSVKTASLPDGVIDSGKYEASVYAHVATAKYSDHIPLHRLEGIFKRHGVKIPKQSMWDMLVRLDELVAQPVIKQMRKELLEEPVLHADETPVTMRMEDGKGSKKGYAWGWRNLRQPGSPSKALIEFLPTRARAGPTKFLGDWSGILIADGYTGYDEVVRSNDITRAGCWSHARRKFKEALDSKSIGGEKVFALIQQLFDVERQINERVEAGEIGREEQLEERRVARETHSRGIVDALYAEAGTLESKRSTLPKSNLGKAVGYLFSQRKALTAFLDDPRLPIHNNDSERDLRHLAVGRNNWLVFGNQRGGEVACRLYSLVLSCKQCGANPEAYLEDVLMKVATTPDSQIATLTPWAWQEAR